MGGAILNNGGTVALTGCTVVSNLAVGGMGLAECQSSSAGGAGLGGAIYNLAGNRFGDKLQFLRQWERPVAPGVISNDGIWQRRWRRMRRRDLQPRVAA